MSERIKKLMLPLLYACLIYAPSVAVTWLLGLDERVRLALLYIIAAFLGYGLSQTGVRLRIGWHVVAAAAVAVPAIFITGSPLWVRIGEGLLCAVLTLWTDRSAARRYWQTVTSRKLLVSVGLLAALQAVIYMERFFSAGRLYPLTPVITGITFFWFIAALFVMNRLSVRGAAYLDDDRRTPRSLTASNSLLVALFLALVMGVAFIRQLRDAASRVVLWLRGMLLRFLVWLMSRQMGGEPGGAAGGNITDMLAGLREDVKRSPFWEKVGTILLYTVLALIGLALLGLIGWGLYRAARRLWRFIQDRLRGFIDEWQASRAGYTEEEENLFSWKQVRDDLRRGAGRLLKRFRPKVRLEDLPDDRSRVRMIFRWTLGKLKRQDKYDPARTPAEYLPLLPTEKGARFVDAYNRARFSVHPVNSEDVEAVRQVYDRL